jgi:uncharacterized membrane protein YphA (DoxX/SURF4 family)
MQDKHVTSAYWALRIALGVVPVAAGIDKFTNLLAHWEDYLSPLALRLLPVSPALFLRAAGLVEIAVGAAILLGYARWSGWVAMGWLAGIAVNLVASGHHLDVAARDLVMAAAAFGLARLAQVHEARALGAPAPRAPAPARA